MILLALYSSRSVAAEPPEDPYVAALAKADAAERADAPAALARWREALVAARNVSDEAAVWRRIAMRADGGDADARALIVDAPDTPTGQLARALLLLYRAERERDDASIGAAEHAMRDVVERAPDLALARNGLGVALRLQHRVPEAIAEFEAAARLEPGMPFPRRNLDEIHQDWFGTAKPASDDAPPFPMDTAAYLAFSTFLSHTPSDPHAALAHGEAWLSWANHRSDACAAGLAGLAVADALRADPAPRSRDALAAARRTAESALKRLDACPLADHFRGNAWFDTLAPLAEQLRGEDAGLAGYRTAQGYYERAGSKLGAAAAALEVGRILAHEHRVAEAHQAYGDALHLADKVDDGVAARALIAGASLFEDEGDSRNALELAIPAAVRAIDGKAPLTAARAFMAQGRLYDKAGDDAKAMLSFGAAASQCQQAHDSACSGLALLGAALTLFNADEIETARAWALLAREAADKAGDGPTAGEASLLGARVLLEYGASDAAEHEEEEARRRFSGSPADIARCDALLGRIRAADGRTDEARRLLSGALRRLERAKRDGEAEDVRNRLHDLLPPGPAMVRARRDDVIRADRTGSVSLRLNARLDWIASWGPRTPPGADRLLRPLPDILDDALLGARGPDRVVESLSRTRRDELHRAALAFYDSGAGSLAFRVLGGLQARSLREALLDSRVLRARLALGDPLFETFASGIRDHHEMLSSRADEVLRRLLAGAEPTLIQPGGTNGDDDRWVMNQLASVRSALASKAIGPGGELYQRDLRTPDLPEVQAALQELEGDGPPVVEIAWHLTEKGLLTEVVTPTSYVLREVDNPAVNVRDALEQATRLVVTRMSHIGEARGVGRTRLLAAFPWDSLQTLERWLLTPVQDVIPSGARLVLAPEGFLQAVPFAALLPPDGVVDQPTSAPFLVRRHELLVEPASTWPAMLFLPPPLDANGNYVTRFGSASSLPEADRPRRSFIVVADNVAGLPPLDHAAAERDVVARRLAALGPVTVACDGCAIPANLASWEREATSADFIHVVAHGGGVPNRWLSTIGAGTLAHLWLGGPAEAQPLWEHRIAWPPISADLVVLSACETGTVDAWELEGGFGLARSFLGAGAHSVIASGWAVDDDATASLMSRLYAAPGGTGWWKADALRAAQLERLDDPATAHPFYWAAFTLSAAPG